MRPDLLHVIVPYFNPFRWESRRRLHREFMDYMKGFAAPVYVVELALGDRDFEVTTGLPTELQLRVECEVPWIKENLINLGIQYLLPSDAKYVAWIDGDIRFENPNWVHDTLHELQHAPIVQMFSECMDVGPSYQAVPHENGPDDFMRVSFLKAFWDRRYHKGGEFHPGSPYERVHCGYAWAASLRFLRQLSRINPLMDFSLVGSADWQMACCFVGALKNAAHGGASPGYQRKVEIFAHRCETHLKGNVSHVPGLVRHQWHGRKRDRRYVSRWSILVDSKFDPDLDLQYRHDGLLMFSGRKPELPLLLRAHSRAKNEDSIDTN